MDTYSCERCRTRTGTPYAFHYGRLADPDHAGNSHVPHRPPSVTAHFTLGGTDAAYLCGRCLRRARIRRASRLLAHQLAGVPLLWLVYAAPVLWVGVSMGRGAWLDAVLWLLVALAVPAGVLIVLAVLQPAESSGEWAAIALHRRELQRRGWDEFWTSREFRLLHRRIESGSGADRQRDDV